MLCSHVLFFLNAAMRDDKQCVNIAVVIELNFKVMMRKEAVL